VEQSPQASQNHHSCQRTAHQTESETERAGTSNYSKKGNSNIYGHEVEVPGGCRVVYRPHNPKCGARVWIESLYDVKVICLDSEELNLLAMTEAPKTIATAPQSESLPPIFK